MFEAIVGESENLKIIELNDENSTGNKGIHEKNASMKNHDETIPARFLLLLCLMHSRI